MTPPQTALSSETTGIIVHTSSSNTGNETIHAVSHMCSEEAQTAELVKAHYT